MILGKISPSDLVELLALLPLFDSSYVELKEKFVIHPEKMTPPGFIRPSWYELYELPIHEHIAHVIVYTGQTGDFKELVESENPHRSFIHASKAIAEEPDDQPFDEDDRPYLALFTGYAMSIYLSIKSLITFGFYINELVAVAGEETPKSDKALFQAVKIDPTVMGCRRIMGRISLAVIKKDQKFLNRLQKAINGKLTKREQKTYQYLRLVLQILQEVGAPQLSQNDLYELFVNQLKIVAKDRDSDIGDVSNNLRQFAYQFIKQKSVSKY